jgi:hypothetical protein
VATRDRNWGTVPNAISSLQMDVRVDSFDIAFDVANRQGEIDFTWHGTVAGTPDGVITYRMVGEAHTTFLKNRIGFCLLHPAEAAGARARIDHVDGTAEEAVLPPMIQPAQPLQPFAEMAALAHEAAPGLWAELRFEGDIFEMEDQRNWTDASYKTFSTPLRLPYPAEVQAGTRVEQAITLRVRDERPAPEEPVMSGAVGAQTGIRFAPIEGADPRPLPSIGLGVASHGAPLREVEVARLSALQLHHLRVDLWPAREQECAALLRQAAEQARALGVGLEIALFLDAEPAADLDTLVELFGQIMPPVNSWIVYAAQEAFWGGTPVAQVVEAARPVLEVLTPDLPIGSGTNYDLIFLSRNLPRLDKVDFLAYAVQPQAHAFDVWSLVETVACQAFTVATAAAHGKPVHVSPVTLKMRRNPYATAEEPPTPPGHLPSQVDPRQAALFGAVWTLGSLKHLAESGAASLTYYETTGWRGVMEVEEGSPVPEQFPSQPGGVFPLYHVLADVGEFAGGEIIPARSSAPLAVEGLILRVRGVEAILLANGTPAPQTVDLPGVSGAVRVRLLDTTTALDAMRAPEQFRTSGFELLADEVLTLRLPPYAVARVDHVVRPDGEPAEAAPEGGAAPDESATPESPADAAGEP